MIGQFLKRARRSRALLDTTRFIVLSNFLRTGIVDFLRGRPQPSAALDEVVEFYFGQGQPHAPEDIQCLLDYYRAARQPTKAEFVQHLIAHANWLAPCRGDVKFQPPADGRHDWNPLIKELHRQFDPGFPGHDQRRRAMARMHWDHFLTMADAFGIAPYQDQRLTLSAGDLARLEEELRLFGDGYYGVDDLLGVLLKVEALRGETGFIVVPPPFMLETCDALALRLGLAAYWKYSPRLQAGGCRVLDLACGSGIYSNAVADRHNECVAVDATPWVFFRAFLGAHPGVSVEFCDMNQLHERVTAAPYTHIMSNIAAHHFRGRPELFVRLHQMLRNDGELCVLNFNYSLNQPNWNPVARMKRQFASQIQYNWSVLEFDRGGVQFVSPQDVERDMAAAGFAVTVHPVGALRELFFVRGRKK